MDETNNHSIKDWRKLIIRTNVDEVFICIERDEHGTTTRLADFEIDVPKRIQSAGRGSGFTNLNRHLLSEAEIIATGYGVEITEPIEFFVVSRRGSNKRSMTDYDNDI